MKIAVTTPRGHVGDHLTRILVRAGIRPLLLDRSPEKLAEELRPYVDVAVADSMDAAQVARATAGVDALYWVVPSVMSDDPLREYAKATDSVVAAVTENGIERVVFQSSVGAEKRHGAGEIDGLAATEVALGRLDADVTILRCGYFFTNLLLDIDSIRTGVVQTVTPLDRPTPWVAPRDIAEVAASCLLDDSWQGLRIKAVHGPEDVAWDDVAALLTEVTGRGVRAERIPDERMLQNYLSAGMPPGMAEAVLGMSTGLRDDFHPEQRRTPATTTPTRLRGWICDHLPLLLG